MSRLILLLAVLLLALRVMAQTDILAEPTIGKEQDTPTPVPVVALSEIVGDRTETGKVFAASNGGKIHRIHSAPIHYQDGTWKDISLTFAKEAVRPDSLTDDVLNASAAPIRIDDVSLSVSDRTGKGIQWLLPARPSLVSEKATVTDQGVAWKYIPTVRGVKAEATVATLRGPQTYSFGYNPINGAKPFSFDKDGNAVSDTTKVPRLFATCADKTRVVGSAWREGKSKDGKAYAIEADFDDKKCKVPYVLDPTTDVFSGTTDGWIEGFNEGSIIFSRATSTDFNTSETSIFVGADYRTTGLGICDSVGGACCSFEDCADESSCSGASCVTGFYNYRGFVSFNTSAITGTVTQANLYLKAVRDGSTADFTVVVSKYDWSSPISSGNRESNYDNALSSYDNDWRSTAGMSIDTYYASGNLDAAHVNKSGTTYYSLGSNKDLAAAAFSFSEYVEIYSSDNTGTGSDPYLEVITSNDATPTATSATTNTPTPANTSTNTATNTATNTPVNTATRTNTPVNTATNTATRTNTPTVTPTHTPLVACCDCGAGLLNCVQPLAGWVCPTPCVINNNSVCNEVTP